MNFEIWIKRSNHNKLILVYCSWTKNFPPTIWVTQFVDFSYLVSNDGEKLSAWFRFFLILQRTSPFSTSRFHAAKERGEYSLFWLGYAQLRNTFCSRIPAVAKFHWDTKERLLARQAIKRLLIFLTKKASDQ